MSRLSEDDLHLFGEGTHYRLYEKLGAHPDARGTNFAVWAPEAQAVSVVGDFCDWRTDAFPMVRRGQSGIWETWVPGVGQGALYKFRIQTASGESIDKSDPYGAHQEVAPQTASIVWDRGYGWGDQQWMQSRQQSNGRSAPMSIYEVHLGSWRREVGEGYEAIADALAEHCATMGFTHCELLPVMEHPFEGSWGYQVTGFFAPTSRWGTPQGLMRLIDRLHQRGIGVILDWVPAHFPTDAHGLGRFDGSALYEHEDPRLGFHPDWTTYIFNYGRHEVRSFLLSSALMWLDLFHVDGLRVDGVASMLYRDYSRAEGEWIPNADGGRENYEAVAFLQQLSEVVYGEYPDVQTIAEESTSWPGVTMPTCFDGQRSPVHLGFGMKWDMGWMHDTLGYFQRDPVHRRHHHNELTFRSVYAQSESFVLALSHDEVVHGKGSLLNKMPGDDWQQRANLRALYSYMWATPGKKLLFMGSEFGQRSEWNHDGSLDWAQAQKPEHAGIAALVGRLNRLYRDEAALHEGDFEASGFAWVLADDAERSVYAFLRFAADGAPLLVVLNLTPAVHRVNIGVPQGGRWVELLNSDAEEYGGSGVGNLGEVMAQAVPWQGQSHRLELRLPPLGALYLKPAG